MVATNTQDPWRWHRELLGREQACDEGGLVVAFLRCSTRSCEAPVRDLAAGQPVDDGFEDPAARSMHFAIRVRGGWV